MRYLLVLTIFYSSVLWAGSYESTMETDSGKQSYKIIDGNYIKVVAHSVCNEIQLVPYNGQTWTFNEVGGPDSISKLIPDSKENLIDKVNIGKETLIKFKLVGKNPRLHSHIAQKNSSREFYGLMDSRGYIGRYISLVEPIKSKSTLIDENKRKRQLINLAAIYINQDVLKVPLVVTCEYISKNIPVDQIEGKDPKCFWIDVDSRSSNGKAYCW